MSAPTRAMASDVAVPVYAPGGAAAVAYDSYAPNRTEAAASGVSWAAVFAGAFAAAALSLILLALGAGAGLSSLSPFSGVSATTVGFGALIYLCITEIVSAGVGGYLAGRLRTKWVDLHTDEVYFRDTAHGFLAWCVALVMSAGFLGAAGAGMVGASANFNARAANNTSAAAADTVALEANRYYIDSLFRGGKGANSAEDTAYKAEAAAVFAHAIANRIVLMPDDRNYVASLVSASTGLNHADAEARVTNVYERDLAAADQARKSVAHSLYWLFVALLLGAFTASFAATVGGHRRDHLPVMRAA
jgi:hypothetical protein